MVTMLMVKTEIWVNSARQCRTANAPTMASAPTTSGRLAATSPPISRVSRTSRIGKDTASARFTSLSARRLMSAETATLPPRRTVSPAGGWPNRSSMAA